MVGTDDMAADGASSSSALRTKRRAKPGHRRASAAAPADVSRAEDAAPTEPTAASAPRAAADAPAVAPAEKKRLWVVLELHRLIGAATRILVSTAGVGIVLLVLAQIVFDTLHPTIDIKPVSMPLDLDRAGYKPDVVSRKIADQLELIQSTASTGHRRRTLYFDRPPLDLTMPGLGFSVSSISTYIKSFLSLEESIVCDVTKDGNEYVMNIRDRTTRNTQQMVTIRNTDLDQLIDDAAKQILRLSDPYVLASYTRRTDPEQAKLLLREVLDRGDAEDTAWADLMWGIILKQGGDIDAGIRYYQMALDAFNAMPWYRRWFTSHLVVASALNDMSIAYRAKNDAVDSTRDLEQAADMGLDNAEADLGERYIEGYGVPRDPKQAEQWLRRAAAQHLPEADYQLALLYLGDTQSDGTVPPDPRQGIARLRYAAVHGLAAAEARLGEAYLSGKNLPRDSVEAKYWLGLAAAKGDAAAQQRLAAIAQAGP